MPSSVSSASSPTPEHVLVASGMTKSFFGNTVLADPDRGTVAVDGRAVSFSHPVQAQHAGVSTVFQEFNLLLERTIAENIWLGREPRRFGRFGPVDTGRMRRDPSAA